MSSPNLLSSASNQVKISVLREGSEYTTELRGKKGLDQESRACSCVRSRVSSLDIHLES